ncbi:sodium:proton antiporter [Nakamurella flava]|uniref:Sodium:proton antiporter n=1 Tax=Nakamurella flava TaxID=2576308 RepID=A0A4U6QCP9_9ACTN|nr:sodium:proton antiporter [Nakamurella flava]
MQRLDRHWTELLQELRVVQTGIQLLTGILLTLPFQPRFVQLSTFQQSVYLVTLVCAVLSGGLLIAPVALHRVLFRRRARRVTVQVAHRLALVGLGLLAVALVGIVLLIFDVVLGRAAAVVAAVVIALVLLGLWLLLPLRLLEKAERGGFEPRGLADPE